MIRSFGVGCTQGVRSACAGLFAASVTKLPDFAFSRPGFRAACDGEYLDACVNLALMDIRGDGGPKDITSASERLKKACAAGHQKACTLHGNLHRIGDE